MKYLLRYPKRFAIAIGAVVMTAINLIRVIKDGTMSQDDIVAFVLAVFTLLGLYYNIPTSQEGDTFTKLMLEHKENKDYPQPETEEPEDASL